MGDDTAVCRCLARKTTTPCTFSQNGRHSSKATGLWQGHAAYSRALGCCNKEKILDASIHSFKPPYLCSPAIQVLPGSFS